MSTLTYWVGKRVGDKPCPVVVLDHAPEYDCGPLWGKGAFLIRRTGKAHGLREREGWVPAGWVTA